MKLIDLSAIAVNISMPLKNGSLIFLQEAYRELFAEHFISVIGYGYDPAKYYIIRGCDKTVSGSNTTVSAGAIFRGGYVYLVDSVTFPNPVGPQVVIGTLTTTNTFATNYDGVLFTDGITRNVHKTTKIVFSAGTAGGGSLNYSALGYIGEWRNQTSVFDWTPSGGTLTMPDPDSKYKIIGSTMHWQISMSTMNMGVGLSEISIKLPQELIDLGYKMISPLQMYIGVWAQPSTSTLPAYLFNNGDQQTFSIARDWDFNAFNDGPDQLIQFNLTFEIGK